MEAKHTAGPWRATLGNSQMSDPGTTIYHRGQWGVYSDADSHGDAEADARLIAAAPDLLEACLKLVEWDDREKDHAISFMARIDLCEEAFTAMRAAIAKANQ